MKTFFMVFLIFINLDVCFGISGVIWRNDLDNFYPIFSVREFLYYEEKFDNTSYPFLNYQSITKKVPPTKEIPNFNRSKIHLVYFEVSF